MLAGSLIASAFAGTENENGDAAGTLRALHSGNGLLNRGLYDLAVKEYADFLSQHANNAKAPIARYGLAVCLFRLDRFEEAAAELTRLQSLDDFAYGAEVATILGQCRLAQRDYAAAANAFEKVVSRHRKHDLADDAASGWTEALYRGGRYEDALNRCRKFVSRWADSPLRNRVEYFGGLSEMATGAHAAAADRFTKMLERSPDGKYNDRVTLLLAQCHHRTGALDAAVRHYRRVLELVSRELVPDALLGLASILQQRGSTEEAGRMLDSLLEEFPQSELRPAATLRRGRVWFDEGKYKRAFASFEEAGRADATLTDRTEYWMAKCALRRGEFAEAAERLGRAVTQHPDSELLPEMHYDRAVALVRAGEPDAAVDALETYLSRFGEHGMVAEAIHLLAATEHQRKHYEDSLAHCRRFADRFVAHDLLPTVVFLTAENEFLLQRYAKAANLFREFLKRYPDAPEASKARFRLGTAMYRLDKLDDAQVLLTQAVDELGTDGAFASSLLALGDVHFRRAEWKKAEHFLSVYLSGNPSASVDDALLKLGLSRQRQEQYETALTAYDQILARHKESPHRLQAMFERGQALVALERFNEAEKAFRRILEEGDDSRFAAFARKHLGTIAINKRDFDAAAEYFDQAAMAMTGGDSDADALFHRSLALMGGQRFGEAEKVFEKFLDRHASDDRVGQVRARLAIALSRQDRYAETLDVIGRLEGGEHARLDAALQSAVQYEKAWCFRKLGRVEEAADAYRALLARDVRQPSSVHAMLDLAAIEADAGRYEPAIELLRRLRDETHSGGVDAPAEVKEQSLYRLAVCEYKLRRFAEAADLFGEFLSEFPDSALIASASFFCGEALFETDRHERAVDHFTRVVERFPSDAAYPASLLRLGECQSMLQRWAKSERAFAEYLDRFADQESWFQATFGIGWARENQQRYDDAMRAYREVVDRHRGVTAARAQFQIGECLFAKKEYADAARELLKVDIHYAYPEWSAGALFEAGRCFEKLGKLVEARAHFRQVTEKYADSRWATMANQRLEVVTAGGLPGR